MAAIGTGGTRRLGRNRLGGRKCVASMPYGATRHSTVAMPMRRPMYYDYGNNVTYENNNVYVNGENAGTAGQYYDQAANLASTGAFGPGAVRRGLAAIGCVCLDQVRRVQVRCHDPVGGEQARRDSRQSTDTVTNKNQVIQGSVDKQTQRVAFTVGENKANVVETGLYNLTKDEAPCLIHFGKDKAEQWLLVRMQQPDTSAAPKISRYASAQNSTLYF